MLITNFKNLARNSLRKKALLIAEAGLEAIDIEKTVNRKIKLKNNKLFFGGVMINHNTKKNLEIDLNNYKNIFIIGVGKGSALASATFAEILGGRLTEGIALDVIKFKTMMPRAETKFLARDQNSPKQNRLATAQAKLKIFVGTHPFPSSQNIKATQKIIKLVKSLKKDDLLIAFVCGGGSALLCGSRKELKASQIVFRKLTEAGANILELNTIRKHFSEVKGGGLARMAYPATVIALIVSDVLGNDLSMVASGPTVFDKTTKKDAEKILRKYQISSIKHQVVETAKDKKYFKKVKNILFLSNREPLLAMAEKAKKFGFKPRIHYLKLKGEAKKALSPLIKSAKKGEAVLAGGETTVKLKVKSLKLKVKKIGKGGRNMEAALGALNSYVFNLKSNIVVMSFASDGRDNTEAAGAIVDASTLKKAGKLKINPKNFLDNHDSFRFFEKTGDLMYFEQKCFNVADLTVVLRE